MTELLVLAFTLGTLVLVVGAIRRRLLAIGAAPTTTWDRHVESARDPLEPQGSRRVQVRPAPALLTRIAASELMVLAAAYLCAVQKGDVERRKEILGTVSGRELLAGLSLVSRTLAAEHGDATRMNTTSVLNEVYADAVRRHREAVILA